MLFTPGYPGFLRGLAPSGPGEFVVTTSGGQVSRYRPASGESDVLADGFDQLYGVAMAPDGTVAAAELGTGRVVTISGGQVEVIASGLVDPIGVAVAPDGGWLVSEAGAGRVVKLTGSGVQTVADEFGRPQGILVDGRRLYVVDAGARALIAVDEDGTRGTIASGLPLGAAPGVVPKPLKGMPPFSGPQGPFAGIAAGPDGTLYVSADADGSVLAFRPEADLG
jgi:glucose/arabinose dehydrogenase